MVSRHFWQVLALVASAAAVSVPAAARTHVLLIGVSHYPNLDVEWQLEGPHNDVDLLAEVLSTGGFGIRPGDVVRLAGWPDEAAARPTRANIERELGRLAAVAQRGDQVLVFLAGHGSRQPAGREAKDLEPDGFDEIFLPADVAGWDGGSGRVAGAITDDEIRVWLTAIRKRGAFVWCLIDACHSGTMTRGGGERERRVPPSALGVPEPAASGGPMSQRQQRTDGRGVADDAGGLVAMYASQPYESAPERILPWPGGRYQGLFTYTVASILEQRRSPLTYRELAAEVAARYRGMDRIRPTPLVEGGGLDREVLGLTEWPRRPRLRLDGELAGRKGHYPLAAGHLAGLTAGTVLTVFPPAGAGEPDRELGHVSIVDVDALRSIVTPIRATAGGWAADPTVTLPAGSRCAVHTLDYGNFALRVALQQGENVLAAGTGPEAVESALASVVERHGALLERVGEAAEADWFVRLQGDDVVLVPSSGWSGAGVPQAFRIVERSRPAELAERLAGVLWTIARAHHLLSLETAAVAGVDPLAIELGIYTYQDRQDEAGVAVEWEHEGMVLEPGQWIAFEVVNRSSHAVDVTLLFVDSGYGIHPLFPLANADNRLGPGERAFPIYRTRLNATTLGRESVVAVAVKADGPQRSFADLAQPTIERYRSRRRGGHRTSAFERLLDRRRR